MMMDEKVDLNMPMKKLGLVVENENFLLYYFLMNKVNSITT